MLEYLNGAAVKCHLAP